MQTSVQCPSLASEPALNLVQLLDTTRSLHDDDSVLDYGVLYDSDIV